MPGSYVPSSQGGNASGAASGGPLPGTAPNQSLVTNNVQNDTVITKRGTPGVSSSTRSKLPASDRAGLDVAGKDETSDINTEVDKLTKADKATILATQKKLEAAGLLDPNGYLPGYADATTTKAYAVLLEEASRSGRSVDEAFDARKDAVGAAGGLGSAAVQRARLSIALTPATDVEQGVKALAPAILGRGVSPAEVQSLTRQYNALQSASQTQDYNLSSAAPGGGTGGSFNQAPSLSDFLKSQLESAHPDEFHAMNEANALNTFFDLLHGGKQFSNTQGVAS